MASHLRSARSPTRSFGRLTEPAARALLQECSRSGMTMCDFARSKGIAVQRLSWWKSKLAAHDRARAQPTTASTAPRFVPLLLDAAPRVDALTQPPSDTAARDGYELMLGDDITLRVPHHRLDDNVVRFVRALRGRS